MHWPPQIGVPLPRAGEAWYEFAKWEEWILAGRGHGPEWATVLRVGLGDIELIWAAIAEAVLVHPVSQIRLVRFGLNCRVDVWLTIGTRRAPIRTIWHFANADGSPRLVSAYPNL